MIELIFSSRPGIPSRNLWFPIIDRIFHSVWMRIPNCGRDMTGKKFIKPDATVEKKRKTNCAPSETCCCLYRWQLVDLQRKRKPNKRLSLKLFRNALYELITCRTVIIHFFFVENVTYVRNSRFGPEARARSVTSLRRVLKQYLKGLCVCKLPFCNLIQLYCCTSPFEWITIVALYLQKLFTPKGNKDPGTITNLRERFIDYSEENVYVCRFFLLSKHVTKEAGGSDRKKVLSSSAGVAGEKINTIDDR